MGAVDGQIERLRTALEGLERLRPALAGAAPPPGESNTEHDWAAGEVLAHLAEMVPYWLGEVERVLAGTPEPVPFGRVATDPVRTLTVDRDRTLPIDELYARIEGATRRAVQRLDELDAAAANRVGLHPRRGEMRVSEIVTAFMAEHFEEHVEQLAQTVGTPSGTSRG